MKPCENAVKAFEEFCKNNETKPTNMKADFYIAGYLKGQKALLDESCKWWLDYLDYPTHIDEDRERIKSMVEDYKTAMEGGEE